MSCSAIQILCAGRAHTIFNVLFSKRRVLDRKLTRHKLKLGNLICWCCLFCYPGSWEVKMLTCLTVCSCLLSLYRCEVNGHGKRVGESRTMCVWLRFHRPSGWRRRGWRLQSVSVKPPADMHLCAQCSMLASCLFIKIPALVSLNWTTWVFACPQLIEIHCFLRNDAVSTNTECSILFFCLICLNWNWAKFQFFKESHLY